MCTGVRYNLKIGIAFCVAGRDCVLCTDTLPYPAVPYSEHYYNRIMLVVTLTFKLKKKILRPVDQPWNLIEIFEYLWKYAFETFRADVCATTYLLTGLMGYISEREK